MKLDNTANYIAEIKSILAHSRQKAYSAVNTAMVEAYWLIGKRIIEEEQNGQDRAAYGKEIIKTLSKELIAEFGKGLSERSLREFRQFYNWWKLINHSLKYHHKIFGERYSPNYIGPIISAYYVYQISVQGCII